MNNKFIDSIPDLTTLGSIILAYFLNLKFPIIEVVPFPFNLIGWVIVVAGLSLAIHTVAILKSRRTSSNPTEIPTMFIKNGPYSFSRNPVYLSYVIVTIGAAFIFGSVSAFIAPVICFTVLNSFIIPFEENNLHKKFDKEYEQYKNLVRKWI
ncbi:MAG: isoprenylcysteine carboxylmethyltransferase family protein [Caldisericales bacterium]|nr:isoprenylcysteine carboxylmethyltransferase family protein [Caldisericales bacterium]